jgi:hypothetical protein
MLIEIRTTDLLNPAIAERLNLKEEIAATGIGDQEPEPVPMAHDAPGNQLPALLFP